jgi:hypothetical protein
VTERKTRTAGWRSHLREERGQHLPEGQPKKICVTRLRPAAQHKQRSAERKLDDEHNCAACGDFAQKEEN